MGLTLLEEDLAQSLRGVAVSSDNTRNEERTALIRNLDEWASLAKDVHESARSSVAILDDLLNFDKVESGTLSMELTTFPLFGLVRETYKEFRLSAQNKKLDFQLVCHDSVPGHNGATLWDEENFVGDSVRVAQVIRNL